LQKKKTRKFREIFRIFLLIWEIKLTSVEESGGSSGGAIAEIVVGRVAGVAVIASVGYFIKTKGAQSSVQKYFLASALF